MWNRLPFDVLAHIFSFLSPDSLARAISICKHWHMCAKVGSPCAANGSGHHPPWFLAMHSRTRCCSCYIHNPNLSRWHLLPLDFIPDPIRPVAPIESLLLCRPAAAPSLQLILCNPFTRQYRHLPPMNTPRANPAVGVIHTNEAHGPHFQVYVAGGMSDGGASYEPTLEMYDSKLDAWQYLEPMPMEFSVRLTVWTPNESVYSKGILYWMTSARAYSVMGFRLGARTWREVKPPIADQLECAALVRRSGRLALFGGTCGGEACVWELGSGDVWELIAVVPLELKRRFLGDKLKWSTTKCVGSDEALYLYRELGCGMLVWKDVSLKGKWEWFWVEGCTQIRGQGVPKIPIKGVLLHPTLVRNRIL